MVESALTRVAAEATNASGISTYPSALIRAVNSSGKSFGSVSRPLNKARFRTSQIKSLR